MPDGLSSHPADYSLSLCLHGADRTSFLVCLLIGSLKFHYEGPILMTSFKPDTSQRSHLQIPSHWGLGFQHMNWGEHSSVHSNWVFMLSVLVVSSRFSLQCLQAIMDSHLSASLKGPGLIQENLWLFFWLPLLNFFGKNMASSLSFEAI